MTVSITKLLTGRASAQNAEERSAVGAYAGIVGIICNALLFVIKTAAGAAAGSVSVIADAVNNLSDASSSIISLLGFRLAKRPADKEHPYGHGRYEYLAALTVAIMIIVIGVELFREGVKKIISPQEVSFTFISLGILVISVLIKLWMAYFYKKTGDAISSNTLTAAALDSRNDVISTLAVLLGAVITKIWGLKVDGYIGVAVALFVIISGIMTVKATLDPVLGKAPDKETVERIRSKIMSYEGVLGTHDLMIHDYGVGRQFASVHVEMSAEGDAIAKHEVIDNIERDFLENDGIRMIVHYDPIPEKNSELGSLRDWIDCEVKKLDNRITIHDLKIKEKTISLDCVVPQDMEIGEKEIRMFLSNIAAVQYPEYKTEVRIDRSFAEIAD